MNTSTQNICYLNCHTRYSLRYGLFSEEKLCQLAQKKEIKTLAVTDINATTACLNFCRIAPKYGIRPLVGVDFRNGNSSCFIGIAQTNRGYYHLNQYLSKHIHTKREFPKKAPNLEDCFFIYPFQQVLRQQKTDFTFNEFIGVSPKDIIKLKFSAYKNYKQKLVFQQPVTIASKKDFNTHRLLRAIDLNILLSKLPKTEEADGADQIYTPKIIKEAFTDYEFILENTQKLADSCAVRFNFDKKLNKNIRVFYGSEKKDAAHLKQLVKIRYKTRYPHPDIHTLRRIIKELQIITRLGFVSFFLINLDIINYAQSQDLPYIGRGSGANSIIAYILGITNVDPIELNLYFERFINPNRNSPPDFDLDFSWKDRDTIIRYIFNRYPHTALMGTYVTFKRRAIIREIGKVFGLPKATIDKLSSGHFQSREIESLERLVIRYSKYIEGLPNYRSVHSGGILILDEPVHNFAATFLPPKGFPTMQIDMNIAEEVGIHKFDILAQRGLPKIMDAVEVIRKNRPEVKLPDIEKNISYFKTDPNINRQLKKGDCMGVFYVESPAMRGLLSKLQTDNYLNLVAASSIIRPGISSSGMKREYIKRHRYPHRRKEAHPLLYKIMPDTYGVMVYQEDVIKVAHHFAGLDLDDADILRRGMSGKKTSREQMQQLELKFRKNCKERGRSQKLTDEIWKQISSFAGYAFPKGHSASYAVESYQSLFLKTYFPLEFMVAVINNGGGFYDAKTYLQEIRNCGGKVHLPDINKSEFELSIHGKNIYIGLGFLRDIEQKTIRRILENRNFLGPYTSLENFLDRVPISVKQISIIIRIEAFRFTHINKHQLLWKAHFILHKTHTNTNQGKLFQPHPKSFQFPDFENSFLLDAYDQIELLGFHLFHPFQLLKRETESKLTVADFKDYKGKTITIYGDLITLKRTRTTSGKHMYFGTFYDYNFKIFDTVHFSAVAQRYPVYGKGIYKCVGRVTEEFGYYSLQIQALYKMDIQSDPRFVSV